MDKNIDVKHFLKAHAYQNIPLNYDEAYALGVYALQGCEGDELAQKQSIAILCALHNIATYAWKHDVRSEDIHGHKLPKNSSEQIAGVCAAVFDQDIAKSINGFLMPSIDSPIMDNCGMGGDIIDTVNVSTLAALIAAAANVYICKHGSPGNTRRVGSSEFVSLHCGINTLSTRHQAENCLEQTHFCYTEALDERYKRIHQQTHCIADLPHMNDIIGPITNPLNPKQLTKRVLGVNHLIDSCIVAEAYKIMNDKGVTNLVHGLFVRGFVDQERYAGVDEVSICPGGTRVAELLNGNISVYDLYASDFGIDECDAESIAPIGDKGAFSYTLLKGGVDGSQLQMVLANAALLFYLAERSYDLKECYEMAKNTFYSGKAYEKSKEVRSFCPL